MHPAARIRMTMPARVTLGMLLAAVLAAPAAGQSLPPPVAPASPTPIAPNRPGDESQAAPAVPVAPWSLNLSLVETWDTNPRFTGDENGSRVDAIATRLTYTKQRTRAGISFAGDGSLQRFREPTEDLWTAGGTLTGFVRPSSRLTLTLNESLAYTLTRRAPQLTEAGLLLPLGRALINASTAGLSLRLSAGTTLAADVRYDRVVFDSNELLDGSQVGTDAVLSRQFGRNDLLSLAYGYRHSLALATSVDTHTAAVGLRRSLGPRWSASALLGVSSLTPPPGESRRLSPTAALDIGAAYPWSSFNLRYRRDVSQAFGLGRDRVGDLVSLVVRRNIGRKLSLSAEGGYGLSRDPFDPDFRFDTHRYEGDVQYRLFRDLDVVVGYTFTRNVTREPAETLDSHMWQVGLNYLRQW